jgi:hypothetical protein
MNRALLEKPPIVQLLKNLPAIYETQRFITVYTRTTELSISCARFIQAIPSNPISNILLIIAHPPTSCSS